MSHKFINVSNPKLARPLIIDGKQVRDEEGTLSTIPAGVDINADGVVLKVGKSVTLPEDTANLLLRKYEFLVKGEVLEHEDVVEKKPDLKAEALAKKKKVEADKALKLGAVKAKNAEVKRLVDLKKLAAEHRKRDN